jgi:hypothetical protein
VKLFLDCDDVLADFTGHFQAVYSGQLPHEVEAAFGAPYLYDMLHRAEDFYFHQPVRQDGLALYAAVQHLEPTIITGIPRQLNNQWAVRQKQRWAVRHFPGVPIICCLSTDKRNYLTERGDVLVDDRTKYRSYWENASGRFILYTSAKETILQLKELGVL